MFSIESSQHGQVWCEGWHFSFFCQPWIYCFYEVTNIVLQLYFLPGKILPLSKDDFIVKLQVLHWNCILKCRELIHLVQRGQGLWKAWSSCKWVVCFCKLKLSIFKLVESPFLICKVSFSHILEVPGTFLVKNVLFFFLFCTFPLRGFPF